MKHPVPPPLAHCVAQLRYNQLHHCTASKAASLIDSKPTTSVIHENHNSVRILTSQLTTGRSALPVAIFFSNNAFLLSSPQFTSVHLLIVARRFLTCPLQVVESMCIEFIPDRSLVELIIIHGSSGFARCFGELLAFWGLNYGWNFKDTCSYFLRGWKVDIIVVIH